jgi:hypothetical protein
MNASPWHCFVCGTGFGAHLATCPWCFESGTLIRAGVRPAAAIDAELEVTNARDLAKGNWSFVTSTAYPEIRIGVGALALIVAPPGNGKSTLATRLSAGFAGSIVYQSVEECVGPSLADRLARCHVRRADFFLVGRSSVDQLAEFVRARKAVALVIDSVQMASFTPEDLRHLLIVLPDLRVLVAVSQTNRRGDAAGRVALVHEADLVITCEDMRWTIAKSRYQPAGVSGDVLPNKEPNDEDDGADLLLLPI